MCILSAFAMFFVILGHIKFGYVEFNEAGTLAGWFPYYSFHLPIFLFISGYFFKGHESSPKLQLPHFTIRAFAELSLHLKNRSSTKDRSYKENSSTNGNRFCIFLGTFILKKAKSLLLPYFVINGIFLLINNLLSSQGFTYVKPFSFEQWLIYPWTKLYVIDLSAPTWYLIAIFIAEVYFVLLRKLASVILKNDLAKEIALLVFTLALGVFSVYTKNTAGISETLAVYLRSAAMLFFMQLGVFYKKYLEARDHAPSGWYFLIVLALQFLIITISKNNDLNPQLYQLTGFDAFGLNYFLAGITGTALWLRVSKLLSQIPGKSRFLIFVGSNTKYIMAFHLTGFFLLNLLFGALKTTGFGKTFLSSFSSGYFKGYLYYTCIDNPRMIILYFFAGLAFACLISFIISKVKFVCSREPRS